MRSRLGQHFLKDEGVLRQIANSLEITSNDVIVEVGAGHGELTRYLIGAQPKKVIAIEKDEELAAGLQESMKNVVYGERLEVINEDALKIIPLLYAKYPILNTSYKLVGNIPYYITGHLLRILGELENKPSLIILTTQKEVAERVCATPPQMNLLAASIQFWAQPKIMGFVKKAAFNPQPEVESAIIKLVLKKPAGSGKDYYRLIKLLFKQPRKTILNNIPHGMKVPKEEIVKELAKQGVELNMRPQNLTMQSLIALSNVFRDKK